MPRRLNKVVSQGFIKSCRTKTIAEIFLSNNYEELLQCKKLLTFISTKNGSVLFEWQVEHLSGWPGGAIALGNLPVPGRPTICMIVGQGPTALAVDFYSYVTFLSSVSLSLEDGPI